MKTVESPLNSKELFAQGLLECLHLVTELSEKHRYTDDKVAQEHTSLLVDFSDVLHTCNANELSLRYLLGVEASLLAIEFGISFE